MIVHETNFRVSTEEQRNALKLLRQIKRGDVSSVLPMIAVKARIAYSRMPFRAQVWVSLADLIQEGVNFTVTKAAKMFKASTKNLFSTYLFQALDNFYCYIIEPYQAQKRDESKVHSLDTGSFTCILRDENNNKFHEVVPVEVYAKSMRYVTQEEKLIMKIDSEDAFVRVYSDASASLRQYLIRWIIQPKATKFKDGSEYRTAQRELCMLAKLHGFTYEMAKHITYNSATSRSICSTLLFKKKFHTPKRAGLAPKLQNTAEWDLITLVDPYKAAELAMSMSAGK